MRYGLATLSAAVIASASAMVLPVPAEAQTCPPIASAPPSDGLVPFDLPSQFFGADAAPPSMSDRVPFGEATDAAALPHPVTIRLGGPPASLFLILQGALCIGFFRGRRRFAALLLAALAAGRTGIASLPRALSKPRHAKAAPCEQDTGQSHSASAPATDYASLLKRLERPSGWGVHPATVHAITAAPTTQQPATPPATSAHGSPTALPLNSAASLIRRVVFGIETSDRVSLPASFQSPLFARPPPLVA